MIISEIFCANLGCRHHVRDPPNIIVGTSLGYSFSDFITNTGYIALIALVFTIGLFYFCFRKELGQSAAGKGTVSHPDPRDAIENKKLISSSAVPFCLCVVVLPYHTIQIGLTVAAIGALSAW